MSLSYIPQKTCTVCSFQVDKSPKKLIATREPITIIYKSDNEPLPTLEDKNTADQFMCMSPENLRATSLASGAGVLLSMCCFLVLLERTLLKLRQLVLPTIHIIS